MESNSELTTLALNETKAGNASVIQRGAFLTRRFFGGKSRNDAARMKGSADAEPPAIDAGPQDQPANESAASEVGTPRESLIAPAVSFHESAGSSSAHGPDPLPATAAAMQPVGIDATADAAGDVSLPEFGPPVPPAGEAPHSPEPRITLPSKHFPQATMTPTQTTNDAPAAARASAQLTLGFEITSLRLTPFFRVGSVQLKALSNVVSLSLIAAQGTNGPMAAGISFQIERVELDDAARLRSILLKPLGESREVAAPRSDLQVDGVELDGDGEGAPISVATSGAVSTAVQLIGTFSIAAMEFSPAFEIDSLRLEPVSSTVRLRITPSSDSDAQALRSSFEIAEVQLGDNAQVSGARLVPSTATNA